MAYFVCDTVYMEIRLISRVKAQGGLKNAIFPLWARKIVELVKKTFSEKESQKVCLSQIWYPYHF